MAAYAPLQDRRGGAEDVEAWDAEADRELSFYAAGDSDASDGDDGPGRDVRQGMAARSMAPACAARGWWRPVGAAGVALALVAVAWRHLRFAPAELRGAVAETEVEVDTPEWKPHQWCGPLPFTTSTIYIPELQSDVHRLAQLKETYDRYVCGGAGHVHGFAGVDPDFWPSGGGRLDLYKSSVQQLHRTDPWWLLVDNADPWVGWREGRGHHVGCLGSHVSLWAQQRAQGASAALITEVDAGPETFAHSTGGCAGDMMGVAIAAYHQVPPETHVIRFDMGLAASDYSVIKTLNVPRTFVKYDLHRWFGATMAGLSLYMVTHKFLDEIADIIKEHKTVMVDAWVDALCNKNIFNCVSVMAKTPHDVCPDQNHGR